MSILDRCSNFLDDQHWVTINLHKPWEKDKPPFFCAFVNKKSGNQKGKEIIDILSQMDNCIAFDLEEFEETKSREVDMDIELQEIHQVSCGRIISAGSHLLLQKFAENFHYNTHRLVVIIGGGDGSITWVLGISDHSNFLIQGICQDFRLKVDAISLLPLGTGNELSRSLGWSYYFGSPTWGCCAAGLAGNLKSHLDRAANADLIHVDRWSLKCSKSLPGEDLKGDSHPPFCQKDMMCFLSLGFDASITVNFRNLREQRPDLTSSRPANVFWNVYYGVQEMVTPTPFVAEALALVVDGEEIPIPGDVRTVQIFSVHSSADGTDFFGLGQPPLPEDRLKNCGPPSIHDGLLEVVGTRSVYHLAQIRLGLSHSIRLAQGFVVRVFTKKDIPIQLDGEGWILKANTRLDISLKDTVPMLLGSGIRRAVNVDM